MPIFWGKVDKNNFAEFTKMGYPMLYRVAVQDQGNIHVISPVYLVDSLGEIQIKTPDYQRRINLHLKKVNTGGRSWVKKGSVYDLFVLDKESNWVNVSSTQCEKDSIVIFNNVPSKAIYRLKLQEGDRELERPFTYENTAQVWW